MKTRRVLVVVATLAGASVAAMVAYVLTNWNKDWSDAVPMPQLQASTDAAVIEQGRYLVQGPAHCASCHFAKDQLEALMRGEDVTPSGGYAFVMGPLGTLYVPNLTPDQETGIGRYSDGQLFRMMQYSVKPDGTGTIEPMMPFGNMAEEDQIAVVSYLRSLPPVMNRVPPNEWSFLGKAIRTFVPTFHARAVDTVNPPKSAPTMAATAERGEYLARNVANCVGCHTPRNLQTGEATGPEFSGGTEMEPAPFPGVDTTVWFRSPNLTPDPSGSLRNFADAKGFAARFRAGRVNKGSPMPWESFARMSDTDLEALYMFFSSLPPVANQVQMVFTKEG